MNLIRLMDPARHKESRPAKVHYQSLDGRTLLCGLGEVYREVDGEQFRIWQETKRQVDCDSCTKRLEVLVRLQVSGLDSGQLEEILAHIVQLKS